MSDFLLLCLPIFGMVAVGWMATAAGVTPPAALDVLGGFSFRFALPALVLHLITVVISGVKLALYPAAVWCVLAWGLGMDPFWSSASALMAALPSAGSNFVLAQRYTDDAERTSAGIVLSTVIGIVTVPLVAWLVFRR